MKIFTFNINGVKARSEALIHWLQTALPDVVCLQEIKSSQDSFPYKLFAQQGYNVYVNGQKGFNGVAVLSRFPLEDVRFALPGDEGDMQARWIEALVLSPRPVRVCCLYLPNGNPAPGDKYDYKLSWMARLEERIRELLSEEEPFLCAGDYNVILNNMDAAHPEAWRTDALFLQKSRNAYRRFLYLGLTDGFRACFPDMPGYYSFWDYQGRSWERDSGILIDHILLSPQAADRLVDAGIEKEMRGGDRPSDHVPVWVELEA